ncbi:MAG: diacylglycerol kinase [Clostridia bacterium]|nr:diacylglycerol kinase [Clostridia bacterium]
MDKQTKEEIEEEKFNQLKDKKNKSFYTAAKHAVEGIICAFKTERNLRIDYIIGLFVLLGSLFFDFTKTEFACLCLTIGFVIFAEMINSTVEYVVDLITDKYDVRAKAAKDIAAGGVLISAIVAVTVAYFLFADKLYASTSSILNTILSSRIYILFTILFAILILCVILKGIFEKETDAEKPFLSFRVTVAFGLTTYVYLITQSILSGAVSLILSLLITSIKIENGKNRFLYMLISAALGVLVVLIVYQIALMKGDINSVLNNIFQK